MKSDLGGFPDTGMPARLTLLNPDQMRTLGYRVVDLLVDHFTELPNKPVLCKRGEGEVQEFLNEPIPQEGRDPLEVLERLEQDAQMAL